MVPFKLGYSVKEAGSHFARNWSTSLGAVVTIFLSLFIIGLFAIVSLMVSNLVGDVESRITIQAFLSDDADQTVVEQLQADMQTWDGVAEVTYKSKEEALEDYRSTMVAANAEDAVAALDGRNPIPASLVVTLTDAELAETVAQRIMSDATFLSVCEDPDLPASSVLYGAETVDRLLVVTNIIRVAMLALVVLLIFVAFVFINNTIRLSIMARQAEIGIMRLVGASNSFIRGPFLMEGVLQALIGYVLAVGALVTMQVSLVPALMESLSFLNLAIPTMAYYVVYALLLVLGLIIGVSGSTLAMRRYLKV